MMKGTMIAAFAAATLLTAGAAVAKPPGGGGGSSLAPSASPKGLGSAGGWTGTPPGFKNSHPGWDMPTGGTPPGWNNPNATGRSWTTPNTPPGISNHTAPPAATTVK
jgi:hypothetical protein